MTTKEEALELAEQLEDDAKYGECDWTSPKVSADIIRRLVKELDKAEERNLKTVHKNEKLLGEFFKVKEELACALDYIKQYQLERKPLSDEEIEELREYHGINDWLYETSVIDFARAIEERHGIK